MTERHDSHARFRELISARVDGQLAARDQRLLIAHLAGCAECRAVDRDFRDQRRLLRSWPPAPPPRDLWARTSAALDREVARGVRRRSSPDTAQPAAGFRFLLASVAVAGMVLAIVVSQLPLGAPDVDRTSPLAAATPFGVPSQALAFLGTGENGLSLYRTRVELVCPTAEPDCTGGSDIEPAVVALPRDMRPSTLALSPSGRQLAFVGRELESTDFIGVVTMPDDPLAQPRADATPDGGQATPRVHRATARPGQSPAHGPSPATNPSTPRPLATAPPTNAVAGLTVLAILEGVRSTGAPPAWSADSSMLAFSAMPADGRHGPDVYVWRPDDPLAQRVTNDHRSYFASWSGARIVLSRVAQPGSDEPISVETAVIDPRTGEQRSVADIDLWLPAVTPLGRHAVGWYGRLEWKDLLASPAHGGLYLADWAVLDPFAQPAVTPPPQEPITSQPSAAPQPSVEPSRAPTEPAAGHDPPPSGGAEPTEEEPAPEASSRPSPEEPVPPASLTAIEPDRDPLGATVVDWQVRWSSDGRVLGYWVADAPGASWGRLVVLGLDPQTGIVDHAVPLLEPTLARRGFTLGLSRVAWVAPADSGTHGELRVRTWGIDGVGQRRLWRFERTEVVPAF